MTSARMVSLVGIICDSAMPARSMAMAADLRKPRVIYSHPKIHLDYAPHHRRKARRARRLAYLFLALQFALVALCIAAAVKVGVTGHP